MTALELPVLCQTDNKRGTGMTALELPVLCQTDNIRGTGMTALELPVVSNRQKTWHRNDRA